MAVYVPEHIAAIKPYVPGKPIEELERELGIKNSVKLASNENPLGASPAAIKAITDSLVNLHRYPDGGGYFLTRKIGEMLGVGHECVVLGNGSDDVIGMLTGALLGPGDEAVMACQSFLMYEIMVKARGAVPVYVPLKADLSIDLEAMLEKVNDKTRMVFITNPNNPTGAWIEKHVIDGFISRLPENVLVVMDEAYVEFVAKDKRFTTASKEYIESGRLVSLRTFSKAYGLAGLRIGYGVMSEELALVLHRIRQPFNASIPAQAGALAALGDVEFLEESVALVQSELEFLYSEIKKMGLTFHRSQANFFLIELGRDAYEVFNAMLKEGVIIRAMASYGFPTCIRVNAGTRSENERFIEALKKVLK